MSIRILILTCWIDLPMLHKSERKGHLQGEIRPPCRSFKATLTDRSPVIELRLYGGQPRTPEVYRILFYQRSGTAP